MGKYNLEEQLERKLKERTIAPSANAWDRVAYNRQLQKKKNKKQPLWFWMAASVIITLGLGMFFALQNNIVNTQQPIQVVTIKQPAQTAHPDTMGTDTFKQPLWVAISPSKQATIANKVNAPVVHKDSITSTVSTIAGLRQIELQKANQVAYAINQIAQKNGQVTNNEIDSLLLSAQKQIAMERLKISPNGTDETALLKEAETEVDVSFREKALNIFKYKFKTIRIAIKDN